MDSKPVRQLREQTLHNYNDGQRQGLTAREQAIVETMVRFEVTTINGREISRRPAEVFTRILSTKVILPR